MYAQLLKKTERISYFFIRTLAKQNETQGTFTNMINTLRVTKCFEIKRKHSSLNICWYLTQRVLLRYIVHKKKMLHNPQFLHYALLAMALW